MLRSSQTRQWWITLPFYVGLLIAALLNITRFVGIDLVVLVTLEVTTLLFFLTAIGQQYYIARLKDRISLLEKNRYNEHR